VNASFGNRLENIFLTTEIAATHANHGFVLDGSVMGLQYTSLQRFHSVKAQAAGYRAEAF